MNPKKLFIVEFGEPKISSSPWMSFGGNSQSPLYVVATNYNEAAEKALAYSEYKKTLDRPKNAILTQDGSLLPGIARGEEEEPVSICGIKLAADEVVW